MFAATEAVLQVPLSAIQTFATDEVVLLRQNSYQKLLKLRDETLSVPLVELMYKNFSFGDLSLVY